MTEDRLDRDMTIGAFMLDAGLPSILIDWPPFLTTSDEWPEAEELVEDVELAGEKARLEEGGELQLLSFIIIMAVVEEVEVVVLLFVLSVGNLVLMAELDSLPDPKDDPWWVFKWARKLQANANLLSHTLQTCGLSPAENM